MPKAQFKITPPHDFSNKEAMDRFIVELNQTLEGVSTRLPSVNVATTTKLRASRQSLTQVASRRAGTIPAVIANPVDVAALKDNLEQQVMAGTRAEMAEMKLAIDTLANVLAQIVDAVVD